MSDAIDEVLYKPMPL